MISFLNPYSCLVTIKKIVSKKQSHMRKHMKTHIDKKMRPKIRCLHCSKLFYSQAGHNGHVKRFHHDESKNSVSSEESSRYESKQATKKNKCKTCGKYVLHLKQHQQRNQ